ncbi:hypothetical protein GCM10022244_12620 [Streptomyces gulbargensis]|uniref:Uncharacterized protein n=1 Tax=Streptomyces gulbargensis TaxID=364901 RepID=A0ABP7LMM7_9ACTN
MPRPPSPEIAASDHRPSLTRLSGFLLRAEDVTAAWERYADEHTDLDGWPYDQDAFDRRMAARDAALWRLFAPVRDEAAHLLDTAEAIADQLAGRSVQTRWVWQLDQLRGALDRVVAAQTAFTDWQDTHPHMSDELVHRARATRDKRAWDGLNDWITHGRAVLEIHATALRAGRPGVRRPLPAPTVVRSTPTAQAPHR